VALKWGIDDGASVRYESFLISAGGLSACVHAQAGSLACSKPNQQGRTESWALTGSYWSEA